MDANTAPVALPLVLAIEPVTGEAAARSTLTRDEAAELAALIAADLHGVVPAVEAARLAIVGGLYDPVELLRPGFPVWAMLEELARRHPRQHLGNVIAFGTHEGQMPDRVFEPSKIYAHGPLRLLPLTLLAPPEVAADISGDIEVELVGQGATGNSTADWLMRKLDLRIEHARYFSRGDILAMVSVQYESVSLAPMWSLLEAALLTPDRSEEVLSARGLTLRYAGHEVIAQSPANWLATQHWHDEDLAQRAHDFAGIVFELRQYATILDAHHVPLRLEPTPEHGAETGWLLEPLADADPRCATPQLYAHEAPGLGVVTVTVAQQGDGSGSPRLLAHGYPIKPRSLGALLAMLADRYGCAAELQMPGHVVLDAAGHLSVPAVSLH
ncbi:MAG: hypothetical protein EPN56_00665 [Rhodanobacter sp.]|nr:MAG: hypothetical protein EPN78_00650 [Rhodanobacter sp.]TAM10939.1 MAG: hypothetical protein EPN66_09200 [Rhodanobacter sp.]TAM37676.1 MAG: hypothetical protein EPN56_00665 [Rhodanobacter sp.]